MRLKLICAQPATLYYAWQTEVMLNSCLDTGIELGNLDIICWAVNGIITEEWDRLKDAYKANFYFYDDTREKKEYSSSIRPNILKQHFKAFPDLSQSAIFYFDCDIVFTKSIQWSNFLMDDRWYGSDTTTYIGHNYILSKGEDVLDKMCKIVDIDKEIVRNNELNSIGAQYLMKDIDWIFWEEVENDSENLFRDINVLNNEKKQENPEYHELQIWCADMWAVLWNAWKSGRETVIHDDFLFSWATGSEYDWNYANIYHNAGVVGGDGLFLKSDYIGTLPYDINLSIPQGTASKKYYDYVQKVGKKSVLIDRKEEEIITLQPIIPLTELKIVSATYGGIDCSSQIRDRVVNGKLIMRANNDIIGDPQVGRIKELIISIEHQGEFSTSIFKEGHVVNLPYSTNTRLGIFYSNNNDARTFNAIAKSIDRIAIASTGKADIISCVWNRITANPFHEIVSWYQSQSHLNQLLQIMQCLYTAKELNQYEYVSFLEHDVMYPEGYFDYPEFKKGTVLVNMNYGGLCNAGWQKRNQNDKPFHQMTMHLDDAIAHCLEILPNALRTNNGIIESNMARTDWYSAHEAIHINHGVHFTSHFSIYSNRRYMVHPYWGDYQNYTYMFPIKKVTDIVKAWARSFNPTDEEKRIAEDRLSVCIQCEFWEQGVVDICKVCSCMTSKKVFTKLDEQPCPKNKWLE
jgi:hypothetical protein